jgi:hypothetical protein
MLNFSRHSAEDALEYKDIEDGKDSTDDKKTENSISLIVPAVPDVSAVSD